MEIPVIREMTADDIEHVAQLIQQLDDVFLSGHDLSLPKLVRTFKFMSEFKNIYFNYVTVIDDQIVGFISCVVFLTFFHAGGTILINELIVDRNYRGSGIGRRLLEEVRNTADKIGVNQIDVGTSPDNRSTVAFYRQNGFSAKGIVLGKELRK